MKTAFLLLLTAFFAAPTLVHAQSSVVHDTQMFEKAKVIQILDESTSKIPGTETTTQTQTLTVEVLSGPDAGKSITFDNDYIQLKEGDVFYVRHQTNEFDGTDFWSVADPYRLPILGILSVVFIALIFIFGGIQGIRGFASLIGSLVLIFYILIPNIYAGYSPVLVSIGVSSLIIILGSYITHGFNRTTSSAVIGMIVTVIITGIFGYLAVLQARLSGYSSEEIVYLNFDTHGAMDMTALLFAGIMIGLLGVLYDIAIGQAVAVEELFRAGAHLSRTDVYKRGIRIGREHIGALVNTLAIAYVGAALPLLLLVQSADTDIWFILNSEVFSTEIIRVLIGSIGLVLAVPITTLIASHMLSVRYTKEHPPTGHSH